MTNEELLKLEMNDTLIALKKETAKTQAVIDHLDKLNELLNELIIKYDSNRSLVRYSRLPS